MAFVRQDKDGSFYVYRRTGKKLGKTKKFGSKSWFEGRNWWLLKHSGTCCVLHIRNINFPRHLIGKKIRLKVEIIKED